MTPCSQSAVSLAATLAVILAGAQPARAEGLVLVESLSAPAGDLAPMDYVDAGKTIDLGKSTVIVLAHLATCTRETVTGGVLHVNSPNSQVISG